LESRGKSNYQEAECNIEKVAGSVWTGWNFIKAMELAPKCKFYTTAGGKSEEEIDMSEKKLGISFSPQCKEFYKKYGYLSFFGNEIYGIDPEDDSGILEGNSVAYALNDREEYNLPKRRCFDYFIKHRLTKLMEEFKT
jgi:hypothetical protein